MRDRYFVYILTNKSNSVLYIGVTDNIERRLYEHKCEEFEGFTKRYHAHKLIYIEEYLDVKDAIDREKQLKRWTRAKKEELINKLNPMWMDLGVDCI